MAKEDKKPAIDWDNYQHLFKEMKVNGESRSPGIHFPHLVGHLLENGIWSPEMDQPEHGEVRIRKKEGKMVSGYRAQVQLFEMKVGGHVFFFHTR